MKKTLSVLFVFFWTTVSFAQQDTASFVLTITGYDDIKGNLWICILDNEKEYKQKTNTYQTLRVTEDPTIIPYSSVPYGTYAIKVFWDSNYDNQFSLKEGDKFGNSGKEKKDGYAKFEDAKFTIPQTKEVTIKLHGKEK